MNSILKDLKVKFSNQNILNKLIYFNIGIFLLLSITNVLSFMFELNINRLLNRFYLPANLNTIVNQPWSFLTYMFIHNGVFHLLFNMLWLHFGGKLFLQHLSSKQLLSTYITGGLFGGLLFIIAFNYLPVFQPLSYAAYAMGASASVFAIIVAIATHIPDHTIPIPFIGFTKLKYIAIFMVTLDILSIPQGNAGGHIAHLGGAVFGYIYIMQVKRGKDLSINFKYLKNIYFNKFKITKNNKKKHRRVKSDYEFNFQQANTQKEIDKILDKIANSGYESLSKEEKANLFKASKK